MVGNESVRHKQYKKKLADFLRTRTFKVVGDNDDEAFVIRDAESFPYYLDLFASNGQRSIAIEIDGYQGHNSRRRILRDMHRTNELKEIVNHLEVFRFTFWQLKGWDYEAISKELKLS